MNSDKGINPKDDVGIGNCNELMLTPKEVSPLKQANGLLRNKLWENSAHKYLDILDNQPFMLPLVIGNIQYILKKAPREGLSEGVIARLLSLPPYSATINKNEIIYSVANKESNKFDLNIEDKPLSDVIRFGLGVEQIYVVNLSKRPDRYVRFLREMNLHGLNVKRIEGVDGATSTEASLLHEAFVSRPLNKRNKSSKHVADSTMKIYKSELGPGVFGYILSQAKVLKDAIDNGYKRILVLDDDVFFCSNAESRLKDICRSIPDTLKILALGTSEYSDRSSSEFIASRLYEHSDLYTPIPGKTCGSFAMVYDQSVYKELIEAINEADGTFDNVILGSIYSNNHGLCIAIDPAIVIPDVTNSDIRTNSRNQENHSLNMNWDNIRHKEYARPIIITVLCNNVESLRHIESMHKRVGPYILNVFYNSADGIRAVIVGHRFLPRDKQAKIISPENPTHFRQLISEMRVPYSDIILLWTDAIPLTENIPASITIRAMDIFNHSGIKDGAIDGVYYSINSGVSYIEGKHSIIIPSYRDATHAWPAIKSALLQDANDFEVIIINDNPGNRTFHSEIISFISSHEEVSGESGLLDRVVLVNHHVNRNASAARNTGIIYSSGEYISFLDDDDHYEKNRLSAMESALSSNWEYTGACYCGYSGSWHGERRMDRFPEGNLSDHIFQLRYGEHYMNTNTVTFNRRCLDYIGGYNESFVRHQDLELMIRFFEHFKIKSINKFLVLNRPHTAPETFTASISNLCSLKFYFLSDMKYLLNKQDPEFIERVIEAHSADIAKRIKKITGTDVDLIKFFLRSALV